jgi:hypothetical protein
VAVAYFYLSGFARIAPDLDQLGKVRILMSGRTDVQTAEALVARYVQAESVEAELRRRTAEADRPFQHRGPLNNFREQVETMDQNRSLTAGLATFHRMLNEGRLEIRAFTGPFLHAKAYIMHHRPEARGAGEGQVIVGSSNLSLPGMENSLELNLLSRHSSDFSEVNSWFQRRWGESQEITPQVLTLLSNSWAIRQLQPWNLYMQLLYWLNKADLGGEEDLKLPGRPLFRFQREAVVQAANRLEQYGGVILADVVGLGKTFTGAALLALINRRWEDSGHPCRPLVVAPPRLVKMWRKFCTDFQIDAAVLSSGRLSQEEIFRDDDFNQYRQFRNLILIDESHNFRNYETNKYCALERLCWFKPTVLLTATPMNRGPRDIYTQLRLFLPDVGHRLNMETPDLREFFDGLPESLASAEAALPLVEMLQQIMIRRTRRYILAHYATRGPGGREGLNVEGTWYYFPRRELKEPLRYDIGKLYGDRTVYDEICLKMSRLQMTLYGPGNYLLPAFEKRDPYDGLKRGSGLLVGLMRTLLLKRFESSVEAFRKTVGRMVARSKHLIEIIEEDSGGRFMPLGKEFANLLENLDSITAMTMQRDMAEIGVRAGRYERKAFEIPRYLEDLKADTEIFCEIYALVADIGPDRDLKLQGLQQLLDTLAKRDEKVLLFSEFEDTIHYLRDNLSFPAPTQALSGSLGNRETETVIGRFAPEPNFYELQEDEEEIGLLLSTDVLSEGQNLQTGRVVINYDLHWNPVRLIQRIGRVDRIGSEHETVEVYNFLPDPELEKNLGLEAVVKARIQEIHTVIGDDYQVLTREEEVNKEDLYAIYLRKDETLLDEEEAPVGLERVQVLTHWMQEKPERRRELEQAQKGLRSAVEGDGAQTAVVTLQSGTMVRHYRIPRDGKPKAVTREEALNLMACVPEAETRELPEEMDDLVSAAREQFKADLEQRKRQIFARRGATNEQKWVRKTLQRPIRDIEAEQRERLRKQFGQGLPLTLLRKLRRMKRKRVAGRRLVKRLAELAQEYHLSLDPPRLDDDRFKVLGALYLW